jgi:hypothetical protein
MAFRNGRYTEFSIFRTVTGKELPELKSRETNAGLFWKLVAMPAVAVPMSKPGMTLLAANFNRWPAIRPAGAPSLQSVITDLTRKLHSENWMEREEAVHRIAAIPDATKSSTVVQELVDLLDRENRLIRNLFKQGTGVSTKYGEGFGEYVSYILDILMKSGNLRDTRTLEVLAYSSYNPDSGFAMNLADNGGAILVQIALELIKSDESFDRWDALSLLGRLYEKRTTHQLPAATVQTIKQTIVNATTHREITTRRWAVRVLGQIGTLDDVALLQRIAATDGDAGPRFSVWEEAVKAIETIRQRK